MRGIGFLVCLGISMVISTSCLANARAYLTDYNSGNVAVIDTATDTLIANSINVGTQAWSVAIGANDRAYFFSSDGVSVVDTQALAVISTIALPDCTNDSVLALDPAAEFLYVGCNPQAEVLRIDLQSEAVVDSLLIAGAWFIDIIMDAGGDRVLVADNSLGDIHILDPDPLSLDDSVTADVISTNGIDLDTTQNRLYVPTWSPNELSVIDPVNASIDATVSAAGWHVSVDPGSAQRAYMLDPSGNVAVIDTASDTVLSTFSTGTGNYFTAAVHPTDGRLYLLNQSAAQVEVYDPQAETLQATVSLPSFVEPRMVGRWLAAGPGESVQPEAIGVPLLSSSPWWPALLALLLALAAFSFMVPRIDPGRSSR